MTILETDRLTIRHLTMDDTENVFALVSDEDVMRYMGPPMKHEQVQPILQDVLKRYETNGFDWWGLILKSNAQFIGSIGLVKREVDKQPEVELCFNLAKTYWGQGLITEAATACRDYAFNTLNLTRLICIMDPQNKAAHRVAEKIGMKNESKTDWDGEPVLIYAMQKNF